MQRDLPYLDFTPVMIKCGNIDVVFITVYMDDGDSLTGANTRKYAQLAGFLTTLGKPWILTGDWKLEPPQLQSSYWLRYVGGEI